MASEKTESWRELEEVKEGERRNWFTGANLEEKTRGNPEETVVRDANRGCQGF